MNTKYKIIEAPQNTSAQEISKAKREFAKRAKVYGQVWGHYDTVTIEFSDKNGIIKADFLNEIGEKISESMIIN